jgi:hypothetical protein
MIAGSTLLTESVPLEVRPSVQGTADLLMGIAGASAGLLSGVVVGFGSFGLLNAITASLIAALLAWTLRSLRRPVATAPERAGACGMPSAGG